jgi:hypothetical protein
MPVLGDVRREFMQRLSTALHGTLGSCLRDGLQEGSDMPSCSSSLGVWGFFVLFPFSFVLGGFRLFFL